MTPAEMYKHLTERVDPNDPVVAEEIQRGVRHTYGITDIHDHMPRLREASKGNVLEIGVRHGGSTSALLLGVEEKGGHLYSVDIDSSSGGLFTHPQWTFIQADSKEVNFLNELIPERLDVLFVDGDHSYTGCFSDLCNFGPRATIIMAHDYSAAENPEVVQAVDDYFNLKDCPQRDLIYSRESHGLAILR